MRLKKSDKLVNNNFLCQIGNELTLCKENNEDYKKQIELIKNKEKKLKEKKLQKEIERGTITEEKAAESRKERTELENAENELKKIIENSDEELEKYQNMDYFFEKFPELTGGWEDYLKENGITSHETKSKKWRNLYREWKNWKGLDLDFMYTRTLQLAKNFNSKPISDMKTDYGNLANDDITTKILRLDVLSGQLHYGIYPELEASLNFESVTKETQSQKIRGTIDWNKTIINSAQTGGVPLNFVCRIRENNFDIPENRLLMLAILWIHNDTLHPYHWMLTLPNNFHFLIFQ